MPVMDGFEAARRIRQSLGSAVPIVAMTADAMPADRERCLSEGMNDYLAKPVQLGDLSAMLAKWLRPAAGDPRVPAFHPGDFLERLMGDRALAGSILKSFLQDASSQLNRLEAYLQQGDAAGLRAQAHNLKGAAATVSAQSLQALAFAIEQAGAASQTDRCRELLPRAAEELERFKTTLEQGGWL
jgi:two-component system sensor histidine kinase/response regulator